MNVFGERQHPEKFIPMSIKKILNGETVIIHSNKDKTKAGSRFYIHARNVAAALDFILKNGKTQDKYNIVGEKEVDNLELVKFIASVLGKELKYEMVDFHSSRPGHDLRYALDGTKMKEMGWELPVTFEQSMRKTILWTLKNDRWMKI
jgi:dTDP-glucose 4,6-dehydratase